MYVLQVADCLEQRVLEPAVLDVLAKKASGVRVLIHHLPDDLLKVAIVACECLVNASVEATHFVLVQLLARRVLQVHQERVRVFAL